MMIETLQSAVALSLKVPLTINGLLELVDIALSFSGLVIFYPLFVLEVVEAAVEFVEFCANTLRLLTLLILANNSSSINILTKIILYFIVTLLLN